jgi:long-chain acyl-CoA synthetase
LLIQDVLEHNARTHPSRVALVGTTEEVTYRDLGEQVRNFSAMLHSAGIGKGDRVAILARNSVLYMKTLFSVARMGAALVPLNHLLIGRELVAILEDADVKALLFTGEYHDRVGEIRPSLPGIAVFLRIDDPDPPQGVGRDASPPTPSVLETDVAMIVYDVGNSSHPRGAMLTHRNLLAAAISSALELSLSRDDVFLSCAQIPFLGGTGRLFRFLLMGGTIVLHSRFDPEEALRAIEQRSVTRVLLTPTMIAQILDLPSAGKFNLSTLRTVLYCGTVIPVDLLKRAIRFFRCGLVQSHGQLESSGIQTILREEDHSLDENAPYMRKLLSVGKEAIGVEVRVVDEEDREIGPNEVGEIVVRGPNVFVGYRNDPPLTATVLRDGWLRTGEMAFIDDEGYLYIVDRKRDTLTVEGISISPRDIENILLEHPSVMEVAVVPRPDYVMGEVPVAVIVLREGKKEDPEEILAHCRRNMAPFKVPHAIEFVPTLPRNSQGKVLKAKLRDRHVSQRNR